MIQVLQILKIILFVLHSLIISFQSILSNLSSIFTIIFNKHLDQQWYIFNKMFFGSYLLSSKLISIPTSVACQSYGLSKIKIILLWRNIAAVGSSIIVHAAYYYCHHINKNEQHGQRGSFRAEKLDLIQ